MAVPGYADPIAQQKRPAQTMDGTVAQSVPSTPLPNLDPGKVPMQTPPSNLDPGKVPMQTPPSANLPDPTTHNSTLGLGLSTNVTRLQPGQPGYHVPQPGQPGYQAPTGYDTAQGAGYPLSPQAQAIERAAGRLDPASPAPPTPQESLNQTLQQSIQQRMSPTPTAAEIGAAGSERERQRQQAAGAAGGAGVGPTSGIALEYNNQIDRQIASQLMTNAQARQSAAIGEGIQLQGQEQQQDYYNKSLGIEQQRVNNAQSQQNLTNTLSLGGRVDNAVTAAGKDLAGGNYLAAIPDAIFGFFSNPDKPAPKQKYRIGPSGEVDDGSSITAGQSLTGSAINAGGGA